MNARQKKFAELYAASGNAVQSAIGAGYSENYAVGRGYELLENVGIKQYICKLNEKAQDERILTAKERQAMLSDIAKGPAATQDRLRAIDILNKMTGEYVTKIEGSVSANINNPFEGLTTEELRRLAEGE